VSMSSTSRTATPASGRAARPPAPAGTVLALVRALCRRLADEGVPYCHWKSNEALDRSASGDNDLDLLVARTDAPSFEAILRELGFKTALAPTTKEMPGVFHAYGLDIESGRLVHIHAHYRLVLGDDMTKNYRLPVEDAYIASATQGPVFRVPPPDFEFVVFVIRMVLKHSTLDAVASGHGRLLPSEARERTWLLERADLARARLIVMEHVPSVDADLWDACVRCLQPGTPRGARIATARRLERALARHARRSPTLDVPVRLSRRARVIVRRRLLHRPSPRGCLATGGKVIALIGGDGAGKSTAAEDVVRWLSKDLRTAAVHLGKPPRSRLSALVQFAWKRGAGRGGARGATVAELAAAPDRAGGARTYVKLLQHVLIARDRSLAVRDAGRAAADGVIVVADRFPISSVASMDAPIAPRILGGRAQNPFARLLAAIERRAYARVGRPDILIVLTVDPDVAVDRKRGVDDEAVVRQRAEEIAAIDWSAASAIVIDAGAGRDDVMRAIRSSIWERL
jgi:thymidylate kinase